MGSLCSLLGGVRMRERVTRFGVNVTAGLDLILSSNCYAPVVEAILWE